MKLTRTIAILLILALSGVVVTSTCFTSAESQMFRYSYISSISATLRITGSSARASGRIIPTTGYASDISVMLQQQSD